MPVFGEELDAMNGLGMTRVLVNALLGEVVVRILHRLDIRRRDHPGATEIILLALAVELRGGFVDRDTGAVGLEWIHGLLTVFSIILYRTVADPLTIIEVKKENLSDFLVLISLQPDTLPLGHLACLFMGLLLFHLTRVTRPRSLPVVHIRH